MSRNSSPPGPPLLNDENPFAAEFLQHPDFRATAGFLLGWVFWSSISYAYKSHFFQLLGRICWGFLRRKPAQTQVNDVEARMSQDSEKYSLHGEAHASTLRRISNETALVFTLNICYAFASFAEFCSILAYDPGGADTACAFTVAWGSMAGQAARLIGLSILVLQLRHRCSSVEFYCLCAALVLALSFILAYNATNTGDKVHIPTLTMSICIKDQYLPTALLTSIGFLVLELYVTARFLGWEDRQYGLRAMAAKSANLQVARGASLVLIDALTFAPTVVITNVLAQFVPFSLGALIVLIAFNYQGHDRTVRPESILGSPMAQLSRVPTPLSEMQFAPRATPLPRASRDQEVLVISNPDEIRPPVNRNKELPHPVVPCSAPPRIGDTAVFADQQTRQILPFQAQYAEQLERSIHTGPLPPLRPKRQRPHVQVVIEDMESTRETRRAPSTIIGSDILRYPSATSYSRRETKETKPWSPGSTATPSDYTTSHTSSPTTGARYSNQSMGAATFTRSASSGSRNILSAMISRQASQKMRSPAQVSLKVPWRGAPRASIASARTFGGREELPPVAEGLQEASRRESGSRHASWRASQSSAKRLVISRPHSLRASRPSSPRTPSRLGLQLPAASATTRPPSSQHLTVPEQFRSPGTPDSPRSARTFARAVAPPRLASPPAVSYKRARGSGRLRGPRSPPMSGSSPNLRSAWPTIDIEEPPRAGSQKHRRRRSDSCPELPPLELGANSLKPYPSVIRR
ncbi:hypothetical protein C8Q79DRAFT_1007043 [Trametes meyenii]|nr:hypothetical protein C8Q79DRAFT_1007043 [Trametes meyenii]